MSTLLRIKNLHPSKQVVISDEKEILDALASLTEGGCHFTFSWCPSYSVVRGTMKSDIPEIEAPVDEHAASICDDGKLEMIKEITQEE